MTYDLVLAAHGSANPKFAAVVESMAAVVSTLRPDIAVAVGYLEHGPPQLRDVAGPDSVIVPAFLASGFHVRQDLPTQASDSVIATALGPDRRLARVLADRLREAGWQGEAVVLAAAGSEDPLALADVHRAAHHLGDELGTVVTAAFLSAGEPRLADLTPAAVASYLLAPGHFADVVAACGAPVVAAPLGADPLIAEIILDRYDAAVLALAQEVRA